MFLFFVCLHIEIKFRKTLITLMLDSSQEGKAKIKSNQEEKNPLRKAVTEITLILQTQGCDRLIGLCFFSPGFLLSWTYTC